MLVRLLIWVLMLSQAVLAQVLVGYSGPGTNENVRYPYDLWLSNESEVSRTVQLTDVRARLYPVAPDLGKKAEARIVFAPGTPTLVELPSRGKDVTLPFRLETDAPRGVYALETNLPSGPHLVDNPPGYTPVADYPLAYTPNLHVPPAPSVGDRFLYLGSNDLGNPSKDYRRDSRPLRHRQVYGRVFILTTYEKERATFNVEGLGKVTLRSASRNFPGLAPILNDPSLATVRRAYVGRRVWQYGGPSMACEQAPGTSLNFGGSPQTSLRVRRVLRVARQSDLKLAGGYGFGGYAASNQGDFGSLTPLVVQFEKPTRVYMGSASGGDDLLQLTNKPNAELLRRCPPFTVLFADAWQLDRTYSLTPPPGLKPRSRLVGLTRSQYAWREGFPSSIFGTKARLLTLNTWKYDSIPFPITVTFRNGRAVKRDVPRLP